MSSQLVLGFDAYTIDIRRGQLLRDGQTLTLRRQSFKVLSHLAARHGQVVSKEDLISTVWTTRPAQPDLSLSQCIKDIRQVLGDHERVMVQTVSGSGYTFTPEVIELPPSTKASAPSLDPGEDLDPPAETHTSLSRFGGLRQRLSALLTKPFAVTWPSLSPKFQRSQADPLSAESGHSGCPAPAPSAAVRPSRLVMVAVGVLVGSLVAGVWVLHTRSRSAPLGALTMMAVPSIAVLPFPHATGGDEADLAQEIATELMRVPRGFGIAIKPDTARRAEGVDSKLPSRPSNARYILSGNVRSDGTATHLNAHLIEADSGRQIWADTFDFLTSQPGSRTRASARVARQATDALLVAESRRPLPRDVKADHYAILGRALLSGRGNAKINTDAMALFEKALALDPLSVPALQGYARTKISAVDGGWVKREQRSLWLDQSERAISEIIKQRPRSYGAYRLRGSLLRARGEPEQAIKAFERALEFNSSYGSAYAEMGRTKVELGRAIEGLGDIRKALTLGETDPAAHSWLRWAGEAAAHSGDYSDALDWLQKAHEADPEQTNVVLWLAIARAGLGQMDAARAEMGRHLAKARDYSLRIWGEAYPDRNPIVAEQRARLLALLRQLNVPEGKVSSSQRSP